MVINKDYKMANQIISAYLEVVGKIENMLLPKEHVVKYVYYIGCIAGKVNKGIKGFKSKAKKEDESLKPDTGKVDKGIEGFKSKVKKEDESLKPDTGKVNKGKKGFKGKAKKESESLKPAAAKVHKDVKGLKSKTKKRG